MAAVTNTLTSTLTLCGALAVTNDIIFNGSNTYEGIKNKAFNDNFNTCIDLKFSDIDEQWRTYGYLTVAEGRTRLRLRTNVNIRDFVYWVRYMIRMSEDTAETPFPTGDRGDIIDRYNTHK